MTPLILIDELPTLMPAQPHWAGSLQHADASSQSAKNI